MLLLKCSVSGGFLALSFHIEIDRGKMIVSGALGCVYRNITVTPGKELEEVIDVMACPNNCGLTTCTVKADFWDPNVGFSSSVNVLRFDCVQQGEFSDCWFVAALSSYLFDTWLNTPIFDKKTKTYGFLFYNGNEPKVIKTNVLVCCTGTTKNPVIFGAKEIDLASVTYSFPAVYEKAYVQFLQLINTGNFTNPPPMLTYIQQIGGDPLNCLQKLCGGTSQGKYTSDPIFPDGGAIFNYIAQRSNPTKGGSHSVNVPFVAWTYWYFVDQRMQDLGIKNTHSYSILGLVDDREIGQCIILRDPDVADCNAYTQKVTWTYYDQGLPGLPEVNVPCGQNNSRGIFAIRVADFKKYFEGFGYVQ